MACLRLRDYRPVFLNIASVITQAYIDATQYVTPRDERAKHMNLVAASPYFGPYRQIFHNDLASVTQEPQ